MNDNRQKRRKTRTECIFSAFFFPAHTGSSRSGPTLVHLLVEIRPLAKPNYSFEKRQREIAKKKQQDEKEARKRQAKEAAKAAADAASPGSRPD